jgi:hypothetical protein
MPFGLLNLDLREAAFLLVTFGIMIPYLLTLETALRRVSPSNRTMEPGMVWLMLVPYVNFVWQFMVALRVPQSFRNEFRARSQDSGSDYGRGIALTGCILGVLGLVITYGPTTYALENTQEGIALITTGIALLMGFIQLALLVVFWIRVAGYSRQLAQAAANSDEHRQHFNERDNGARLSPTDRDRFAVPPDA